MVAVLVLVVAAAIVASRLMSTMTHSSHNYLVKTVRSDFGRPETSSPFLFKCCSDRYHRRDVSLKSDCSSTM